MAGKYLWVNLHLVPNLALAGVAIICRAFGPGEARVRPVLAEMRKFQGPKGPTESRPGRQRLSQN